MTGIFFGSTTGNTEQLAADIAAQLGVDAADIHNVGEASADAALAYDVLLLGSSTWGCGDLQDDWYDFLDQLKGKDLSGKKVGLFGCGDSESYPDTFCGALTQIHDALEGTGCTFIGQLPADAYDAIESDVCTDQGVLGLAVDESHPDQTDAHLAAWVELIKNA